MELFTDQEYNKAKSRELLKGKCDNCNKEFYSPKNIWTIRKSRNSHSFCSESCRSNFVNQQMGNKPSIDMKCEQCGEAFHREQGRVKHNKNVFCSRSCSVNYNKRMRTGVKRSKLEVWIEQQLTSIYPNLEIHYNRKDAIGSELDIYIPYLRLAFELNGIFHYEPIFGPEKLKYIQNNDQRKFQACLEQQIEFCTIDVSSFNYFKEQRAKKFLNIITMLINKKLLT